VTARAGAAGPPTAGTDSGTPPFRGAIGLTPAGNGSYTAELGPSWTVGGKAHGGLLLVLLVRAGLSRLAGETAAAPDPLAVSADFLRAPDPGAVVLRTEVLKVGRTASVAAVRMLQDDRTVLTASVTAGRLAADEPRWAALPELDAEPPADALTASGGPQGEVLGLASACDLRFDAATFGFARREQAPPVLRGWVRPLGEEPDVLFAVLAGDILPPTVFNVSGRFGWAPTVQLTALLRARPAPGWLRLESRSTTVAGPWFDEDVVVVDSAGRLVCQARQLALAPLST
jgi:hypothetical protein